MFVPNSVSVIPDEPQTPAEIRDDHLPLNEIAGIPTCDIIDFDYPAWHTTRDNLSACSRSSLSQVGRVLRKFRMLAAVLFEPAEILGECPGGGAVGLRFHRGHFHERNAGRMSEAGGRSKRKAAADSGGLPPVMRSSTK